MIGTIDPVLLKKKAERIAQYLRENQAPDGEFRTLRFFNQEKGRYGQESEFENWYYFGKCPFTTANVLHHLREIDLPEIPDIIRKGCVFLEKGMEKGVCRYIPPYHQAINFPADIDDTSLALAVLKENGFTPEENLPIIFGNEAPDSNFYTWFIPRFRHFAHPGNFLWLTKDMVRSYRKAKHYGESLKRKFREHKLSAEPAITANVLLYLGENDRTRKYVEALVDQTESGNVSLQYYANILFLYFHIARLYHSGIRSVERLKDQIHAYLMKLQRPDGEIENGFNTGLSALILIYFRLWDSEVLQKAVHYLAFDRMHEQGWRPMACCNDLDGLFIEGSPEYTATLYLESLYRYQQHGPS